MRTVPGPGKGLSICSDTPLIVCVKTLAHLQITGMWLGRIILMQLSYTPLLILLSSAVVGDVVITCREARRDWLQQLRLINNRRVQHYANEAARVVQVLYRAFCYFILFWRKLAKFLHNSCARVLFYFIANGRTALRIIHQADCCSIMHTCIHQSPGVSIR